MDNMAQSQLTEEGRLQHEYKNSEKEALEG